MDDTESRNQDSYFQNIVQNLRNKVFSPKAGVNLNSNMAAPHERNLDLVKLDALILAKDIVHYVANYQSQEAPNVHAKTMRRTVNELREKYEITFKGMFKRLEQDLQTDDEQSCNEAISRVFCSVVEGMFKDRRKNWGRIVSLYAFGGLMAKHFVEIGLPEYVDYCGLVIGEYVCALLATWIHENGGWDAFDEYFDGGRAMENRIVQGLFLVGGIGAAALAMGMIAVR